jgi:HD-GYP domain-containing protein (c-di-GMP phosphodiesterase class II)
MSAIDDVLRELLTGIQNARLYFVGHTRVSASASSLAKAASTVDAEEGLVLGLLDGVLVHATRPLLEATRQAEFLMKSLGAWNAGGIYIQPGATKEEVIDLIVALAFPPAKGEEPPRIMGTTAGLLGPGAVRDEKGNSEGDVVRHEWEKARQGRLSICQMLQRTSTDLEQGIDIDVGEVGAAARNLSDIITDRPHTAISQVSMQRQDDYTFTHTLNVAVFALTAAKPYVADASGLPSLAQAALLHDVGKVVVPREVLYKQGSYTPAEWEIMRSHPVRGAEILSGTEGVDDLAVMTAYGHHWRTDGSGYPKLQLPMRPHPFVSLLSIADVYEALTAERPYKQPMPPGKAMAVIIREAGRQFEASLVRAFVRSIGIFRVGTSVHLTDGRTGIVSRTAPGDPDLPLVHIVEGNDDDTADGIIDLASETARARGLRITGTLEKKPSQRDVINACA